MTTSNKKKKEKAKDFQKTKLKVGKARPKNTNATNTSFSAKSIVLKQQNLDPSSRDLTSLFTHNLSLLGSKSDTQRRDALQYLAGVVHAADTASGLPQPPSVILTKAQPLILDGNKSVREGLLKLLRILPVDDIGSVDQLLLFIRAGMAHLSTDIRLTALDALDWIIRGNPHAVLCSPGSWIKTLRTFQNLLSWTSVSANSTVVQNGRWTATKSATNLGNTKLIVHQLSTLVLFLTSGLTRPGQDLDAAGRFVAACFPLTHHQLHAVSRQSRPFAFLNLFGVPRDVESEVYDTPEERAAIFAETGLQISFELGVSDVKKEGGEIGRAASAVIKALKLANPG